MAGNSDRLIFRNQSRRAVSSHPGDGADGSIPAKSTVDSPLQRPVETFRLETLLAAGTENSQGRQQANLLATRVGLKKCGCLLRRDVGQHATRQTPEYGGQIDGDIALDPDKPARLTGRAADQLLNQLADSLSRAKNGRKGSDSGSVRSQSHNLNIGSEGT